MAILQPRQHSFSSIHEQSATGWNYCMTKAYCKWPAIAGIVVAVLVACLTLYCCLRCCGCCGLGRGRRRARGQSNQPSMFNPMPYQGYQPANSNVAPPPYGQPPAQYAQFDNPSGGGYRGAGKGGGGEDSLPAMPSWQDARSTQVEDHEPEHGQDVELGHLQKPAMASTTHLAPQQHGYNEADSHPVRSPHEAPAAYTGPDFTSNTAAAATTTTTASAGTAGATHYTGPDFSSPTATTHYQSPPHSSNTAYSAYAPSESTRYEPSYANEPHELGTTYSNTLPPPSPSAQHTGFAGQSGGAPGVLQAGRRPDGQQQQQYGAGGSWRDL